MDFQVHIRTDGNRFDCLVYHRRNSDWVKGPIFEEATLTHEDKAQEFADRVIEWAKDAEAKSAGIVLHFAEDFATAELRPNLDLDRNLVAIREEIDRDPKACIADNSASIEENSWRILRYPGLESGATAIGVSRRWSPFLETMRKAGAERNFPVVTQTLSSPLVALLSLADFKKDGLSKPLVAILPYARFTVMGFLNREGNLLLLRSIQHRGQRGPGNLRQVISATAASLELIDPEIHLIPTDPASEQRAVEELGMVPQFGSREQEMPGVFRHAGVISVSGPSLPLEFRVATTLEIAPGTPLGGSRTFTTFRDDGWVTQDFLSSSAEASEVYPTRAEMRLLRTTKIFRTILFLGASFSLIYFGKDIVKMVGQPEWSYKEQEGLNLKQRQMMLGMEKNRIEFWDNLLDDRSRAWSAMELLPRLVKDPKEIAIRSFGYTAAPSNLSGQAKLGLVKEWKISGLTRPQELEKLTRENVTAIFNEIAARSEER
ncbi:MAG: hypothetical protein JWO82_2108, partial [Akkermansiaceae bacterium]|nr:hypothetical protein [Akkermansiaceae bacterium]